MANGSKLDKEIFEEFENDWEELSYQAQLIYAKYKNMDISKMNSLFELDDIPEGKYRECKMKVRVGQYFFRISVLASYGNKCCITGLKCPELLIASHIKPWAVSNSKTERTNPSNGLCLNALHDRAFDQGLITIDNHYRIVISNRLCDVQMDQKSRDWFLSYNQKEIMLPDKFLPGKSFIEYHNDMIFQR